MRDYDKDLREAAARLVTRDEGSPTGMQISTLPEDWNAVLDAIDNVKGKPTALEVVTRIDGADVALLNREEGHKAARAEMTKVMRELWDGSPAPQGCVWPWELAERAEREAKRKAKRKAST